MFNIEILLRLVCFLMSNFPFSIVVSMTYDSPYVELNKSVKVTVQVTDSFTIVNVGITRGDSFNSFVGCGGGLAHMAGAAGRDGRQT